jgi:hypothetical protein
MALKRISVDEACKDGFTCPSVWADDNDPEHVLVVGEIIESSPVPLGPGETAFRIRRQVLRDAHPSL